MAEYTIFRKHPLDLFNYTHIIAVHLKYAKLIFLNKIDLSLYFLFWKTVACIPI